MSQPARAHPYLNPVPAVEAPTTAVATADLQALWFMVRRRRSLILGVMLATLAVALVLGIVLPARYAAQAVVMIDPRKTQLTGVDAVVSALTPDIAAVRTEVAVIQSRAVVDRVIADLKLLDNLDFRASLTSLPERALGNQPQETAVWQGRAAEKLLDNLSVANDGRSFSIALTYRAADPAFAAVVANAFADAYVLDQLESKYQTAQRASSWLSERLDTMRAEVQQAEKAVEDYKNTHGLLGVGTETITQQQLVAINSSLVTARAERAQAQARLRSAETMLAEKGSLDAAATVLSSPLIQSLKQQEAQVRRKEAELAGRYGEKHPTLINARAELRDIRAKISEEVQKIMQGMRNEVDMAEAKVASLSQELAVTEGHTGTGDQAMVELRQLQREATASRELYEGFLNRYKQVAEQQDLQVADARIVARAETPIKPVFPSIPLFLAIGLLLGGMCAFLVALLVEYFDKGYRHMGDIERTTGLSPLGTVPLLTGTVAPADYVQDKPLSYYAESLRMVYTACRHSGSAPAKVMMVTSSVPGEGKTTFCLSLGRVLAAAGHRVLLIDADVRRPRTESVTNTRADLQQVLAGTAVASAAVQTEKSGLHLLPAGPRATGAQQVLAPAAFERLLHSLRTNYDIILVDTPPVLAVADTASVAGLADGVVYVVQWAETPRQLVQQGTRQLQAAGVNMLGAVMTQVDMARQANYAPGGNYASRYQEYYAN